MDKKMEYYKYKWIIISTICNNNTIININWII